MTPAQPDRTGWETGTEHLRALVAGIDGLHRSLDTVTSWGTALAAVLADGGRLLVAGNGGSAAQAQHLTAEIVGRYETERAPYSALTLHADTSTVTAVGNDYGPNHVFARQVRAHGRPGDVLLCLSTSGRSGNVLAAAEQAKSLGMTVWALTGPTPSPLADMADECVAVHGNRTSTIQELHLVVLHLLCMALDSNLPETA